VRDVEKVAQSNPAWCKLWEKIEDKELLVEAYHDAWSAGHHQGRQDGIRECSAEAALSDWSGWER